MKNDKETVVVNEQGLPTNVTWESQFLKQTISYTYDGNVLVEERIVQIDKVTEHIKIASCVSNNGTNTITVIDGSEVDVREVTETDNV